MIAWRWAGSSGASSGGIDSAQSAIRAMLLAILLLPLDVGARRVLVGWRDLPRFWGELRGRFLPAPLPAEATAGTSFRPLFEARRRGETRTSRPAATEIAARLE